MDYETTQENQPEAARNSNQVEDFFNRNVELYVIIFNQIYEMSLHKDGVTKALKAWRHIRKYFPRPAYEGVEYNWDLFKMVLYLIFLRNSSREELERTTLAFCLFEQDQT